MDYENTYFPFMKDDCIKEFGNENGQKIYDESCKCFTLLMEKADCRNNKSIKEHFAKNMFPIIAYYLTLLDKGFSKDEAYNLTLKETQKAAHNKKVKNESIARLPFAYKLFKFLSKKIIGKNYPKEGWDIEWIKFDNSEIHMNFNRCIYFEMTSQCGCPELCTVFCRNDNTAFSGFEPKIHFMRTATIAEGAACCDFHFIRGSR